MSNPLNDIAPYPDTEDDVTADGLARNWAVWARANGFRRGEAGTETEQGAATAATVHMFGLVKLLRALQTVAPDVADEVAKDLWSDLFGGAAVDEWLQAWLTEYGIDPELVNEAAAGLMRDAA